MRPGELELTYIGVHPSARGKGVGGQLIHAFAEAARRAGYTSLVLSVETDNPAAIALYEKHGFIIRETFQEGAYHRHRMACSLTQTNP
jgi:ribosomal protein S18 acetylase RimI-like enzyme